MNKNELTVILDKAIDYFKNLDNKPTLIFLFGSYAKNKQHKGSDIDIAVLYKNKPTIVDNYNISNELSQISKYDVDYTSLNGISDILQYQVIRYGKEIYSDHSFEAKIYKTTVISKYIDLKENRKIIEKKLLERIDG
ncbi:MAG TPA: hypothetical protein DF296_09685 [Candidatus Margulisbacteria bacterium]|nr:MAG: hypothetical protein A2X41_00380 [Candidatus Margulisbacteria bacterium GWE2_39_32]HCT85457.1 hypothetical protein [Candidatus Margulisiibacteriota bacterium]